jgi:hypothetical protein
MNLVFSQRKPVIQADLWQEAVLAKAQKILKKE